MADPLAGLSGGVNAGPGKRKGGGTPRFPMPLDHPSSGLRGLTGSTLAPMHVGGEARAAPTTSLRGLSGSVNAGRQLPSPRMPNANYAKAAPLPSPTFRLKQILGNIKGEEQKLGQFIKGGEGAVTRGERLASREQRKNEERAKAGPTKYGGVLGAISNLGTALGSKELAGARTIFGTSGIPGAVGNALGKGEAELINIPTQAVPATAKTISSGIEALKGHPAEFQKLGKEFGEHSVIGALGKSLASAAHGNANEAVSALKSIPSIAGEHPIGTALEVMGGARAVDRGLGSLADATGARKTLIENGGSLTEPSRGPAELVPGGASKARPGYDKGLLTRELQKYKDTKGITNAGRDIALKRHFDSFQGQMRRIVSMGREAVRRSGHSRSKGLNGAEQDLIVPFGKWLANPDVRSPHGDYPLWRDQIAAKQERLARMTPNSAESTDPLAVRARDDQIQWLQHIMEDRKLVENEGRPSFAAAKDLKGAKDKLKPDLQETHHTPEEMRIAEMKPAFHEYFHDQQPRIDTTVPAGESPFFLGGKNIPVDRADQMLHDKGFTRDQRFFTSDSPNRREAEAWRGGYSPGGERTSKGILTGNNFIRGQSDLSYGHGVQQHAFEQLLVNIAHGDRYKVDNYFHDKEALAKQLEAHLKDLGPNERKLLQNHIDQLRHEKGARFFEERNGRGPTERAAQTAKLIKEYTGRDLVPMQIARPFATAKYRKAVAPPMHEDISDKMDPYQFADNFTTHGSLAPQIENDAGIGAGHVGLVDRAVADRMKAYDAMVQKASLLQQAANYWRQANIAWSIRHVPGVSQEMGIRMAASSIGALSALRSSRALPYMRDYAEQSKDPQIKLGMKRYDAYMKGTGAAYSEDLARIIRMQDLERSKPRLAGGLKAAKGNPITGTPLKLIQGLLRGYGRATKTVLKIQRNSIEHPPQVAGLGRHFQDEFKTLTGKSLRVFGPMRDIEKDFMAGRLQQANVEHAINAFRDYWGEWNRAGPEVRKFMVVSPFFQWYMNSLRFVYHLMPAHHPLKTATLVMLEAATEESRKAEGQGYQGGFPLGTSLNPGELEPSQQGSIPFGKLGGGEPARWGAEYYSPPGAISGGADTFLNSIFPFATGAINTVAGYNPVTKKPVEEENPETGKKEPVTDQNKLVEKAAMGLLESFVPAVRYVKQAEKPRPLEKQDPLVRLMTKAGLSPGLAYAVRPLRTEATYKTKEPGGSSGGGIGSVGGLGGLGGVK